jgi:hypothetical protein
VAPKRFCISCRPLIADKVYIAFAERPITDGVEYVQINTFDVITHIFGFRARLGNDIKFKFELMECVFCSGRLLLRAPAMHFRQARALPSAVNAPIALGRQARVTTVFTRALDKSLSIA